MNYLVTFNGNVLSGYILMFLTSGVLLYFFCFYKKRLKKIKLILPETNYFNKKMDNFFTFYLYFAFIPQFLLMTAFFIVALIFVNTTVINLIFTICYLIYTVQILLYVICLNLFQNSIVCFVYENQLILFNEVINMQDITEVKHNLKRTVIFINFNDENGLQDFLRIKYHWKLMDFLKDLNLKIAP